MCAFYQLSADACFIQPTFEITSPLLCWNKVSCPEMLSEQSVVDDYSALDLFLMVMREDLFLQMPWLYSKESV